MQIKAMFRRVGAVIPALAIVIGLLLSILPVISVRGEGQTHEVDNSSTLIDALNSAQSGDTIMLTEDINLYDTSWTPVNIREGVTFNGNHKVIFNLGNTLFDTIYGTVFNVGVVLNGNHPTSVPAIMANNITGSMFNCFAFGSLSIVGSSVPVGGLVSRSSGSIEACFSLVNINSGATYVGGLVGLLEAGTVQNCYSAGTIKNTDVNGYTAGFANISDTASALTLASNYTTCQLRTVNSKALPSGINALYDNQLSLVRENITNQGLSTKDLMTTTALSDEHFAVTSTTYPTLKVFLYSGWGDKAKNVVRLSVAAAAFSDVDPAARQEPSAVFTARADYLTRDVYVDRTNTMDMKWSINSTACKLYDTVPQTTVSTVGSYVTGTSADLLRARLQFTSDAEEVVMTAADGGYSRTWYLRSDDANPYFQSGNGTQTDPYHIANKTQLDYVRYYTRMDKAAYKVVSDIAVNSWDPIVDFRGSFNGGNKTLSNVQLNTSYTDAVGLFANVKAGSSITNVILNRVTLSSDTTANAYVGALVGKAGESDGEECTFTNIVVCGSTTKLHTSGTVGGVAGQAVRVKLNTILISADVRGETAAGGIVGEMHESTMTYCGVTGAVSGYNKIGGLVGTIPAASEISNSYVTAAVISDATAAQQTPLKIGGLVGDNAAGSVNNSYVAGALHATYGVSYGVFVGVGSTNEAPTGCVYDSQNVISEDNGGLTTANICSGENMASFADGWTKTNSYYPQITYFAGHTLSALQQLSALSTVPFVYQNYWQDGTALDMTTGWLPKEILSGSGNSFTQPEGTMVENVVTYDVNNGWGFEAICGSETIAVSFTDSANLGLRKTVAKRPGLMMLSYTVSGIANVNTYVDLQYSIDGDDWQGSQVMSITDDSKTIKQLYDVPENSLIRVRVHTADDYAVESIMIGDTVLSFNEATGYYETAASYNDDVVVSITLKDATPEWGLRRESY